ncbi:hypothetical protein FB639_006319 [Coemansia asiatica]|nr:hypothetical protein FB639_006319 [Coemansia asiatica]
MTIVNYPGYPTAPEFNHNYDTAIDLYTSTEKVTVSPNGSGSSGGSGDPNSSAGASVKAYNANAAVSSAVATTLAAAAATEVTSAGVPKSLHINKSVDAAGGSSGACSGALMQCSGTGYQMCVNGAWSPVYPCGPGTACKSSSPGAIFCGWP